jgi:hypothetical protein
MSNVVPLEAARVRRGHNILKRKGAWFVKTTGIHMAGCPDTLVCYKGYFIGIEWKQSSNARRRATQHAQLEKIKRAGGYGMFCWDVKDLEALLERIDKHGAVRGN